MLKKTTSHAAPQTAPLARPLFALLACALCVTALNVSRAQSGPLEDLSVFPRTSLEILHGKKQADPRVFNVWIANNEARQEQGLMFVQDLPQGQGMLFPLKKPKKMTLWMKNTYVELDMLFISEKVSSSRSWSTRAHSPWTTSIRTRTRARYWRSKAVRRSGWTSRSAIT